VFTLKYCTLRSSAPDSTEELIKHRGSPPEPVRRRVDTQEGQGHTQCPFEIAFKEMRVVHYVTGRHTNARTQTHTHTHTHTVVVHLEREINIRIALSFKNLMWIYSLMRKYCIILVYSTRINALRAFLSPFCH
jgi:hypothetical protein